MATNRNTASLLLVVVLVVGAIVFFALPDQRSTGQKLGDAVDELPNVSKAARQLEDRTPAQKLGDAAKDAGDDVKRATQ